MSLEERRESNTTTASISPMNLKFLTNLAPMKRTGGLDAVIWNSKEQCELSGSIGLMPGLGAWARAWSLGSRARAGARDRAKVTVTHIEGEVRGHKTSRSLQ